MLNHDITTISPEQIRDVSVLMTLVDGKIVFVKDGYEIDFQQEY